MHSFMCYCKTKTVDSLNKLNSQIHLRYFDTVSVSLSTFGWWVHETIQKEEIRKLNENEAVNKSLLNNASALLLHNNKNRRYNSYKLSPIASIFELGYWYTIKMAVYVCLCTKNAIISTFFLLTSKIQRSLNSTKKQRKVVHMFVYIFTGHIKWFRLHAWFWLWYVNQYQVATRINRLCPIQRIECQLIKMQRFFFCSGNIHMLQNEKISNRVISCEWISSANYLR